MGHSHFYSLHLFPVRESRPDSTRLSQMWSTGTREGSLTNGGQELPHAPSYSVTLSKIQKHLMTEARGSLTLKLPPLAQVTIVPKLGWWGGGGWYPGPLLFSQPNEEVGGADWRHLALQEFSWDWVEAGWVGRGWRMGNLTVWLIKHRYKMYSMPILEM